METSGIMATQRNRNTITLAQVIPESRGRWIAVPVGFGALGGAGMGELLAELGMTRAMFSSLSSSRVPSPFRKAVCPS
ncbi:MAG: hypothetical protein OXF02_03430 [Simkaniaceae bacterium]|nr:hypothetical protein [Simkaniaceae bacterium]